MYSFSCSAIWDTILLPKFTCCQCGNFVPFFAFKSVMGFCGFSYYLYTEQIVTIIKRIQTGSSNKMLNTMYIERKLC